MKRTYEEWLKYYENATKEQVIEDMTHDFEEIERLNNIIDGVENLLKRFKGSYREIPIQIVLNEIRELKGDKNNDN